MEFDDDAYEQVPVKATLISRSYTSLPKSYSLKKYCPTPKDQGSYSTCVGWATAYAGRTIIEAKQRKLNNQGLIDAETFSGAFIYKKIATSGDYTCRYGTYIHEALSTMQTEGVPKYKDFNPICPASTTVSSLVSQNAKKYKIKDYNRLFGSTDSYSYKIQSIKKSISQGNPIVIGMKTPTSFYTAKNTWKPTESPYGKYGGHAMCVIGYDDTKQAVEVMNSWGADWGNGGFIWIGYKDFANFTKYAYELIALPTSSYNTVDLAGSLKLEQSTGNEMKASLVKNSVGVGYYKMKKSYSSGTKFRIHIANNEPAFVYAIGSDLSNKIFQIFPHKKEVSPALTYSSNSIALPSEDYYVKMDNNVGTDYMCILYSREKIDLEQVKRQIASKSGTFLQRVQQVFTSELVSSQNVKFENNQIQFSATSKGKSLVALMLEIEHTN